MKASEKTTAKKNTRQYKTWGEKDYRYDWVETWYMMREWHANMRYDDKYMWGMMGRDVIYDWVGKCDMGSARERHSNVKYNGVGRPHIWWGRYMRYDVWRGTPTWDMMRKRCKIWCNRDMINDERRDVIYDRGVTRGMMGKRHSNMRYDEERPHICWGRCVHYDGWKSMETWAVTRQCKMRWGETWNMMVRREIRLEGDKSKWDTIGSDKWEDRGDTWNMVRRDMQREILWGSDVKHDGEIREI